MAFYRIPTSGRFSAGAEPLARFRVNGSVVGFAAPLWAWALAFGLLPGWQALAWYRRRRKRAGVPAFEVVTSQG